MAQKHCLLQCSSGGGVIAISDPGRRVGGLSRGSGMLVERTWVIPSYTVGAAPKSVRLSPGSSSVYRHARLRCEAGSLSEPSTSYASADNDSMGNVAVIVANHEGAGLQQLEHAWVERAETVQENQNGRSAVAQGGDSTNGANHSSSGDSKEKPSASNDTDGSSSGGHVKPADTSKTGMKWNMLLSTEALEDAHLFRASSVTDAHVLRRKGRLKEQDGLIEFIISMHHTHSPFQVMEKVERWVREHVADPNRSTLNRLIPHMGPRFHTPLPLVRALHEYDEFASLSRRKYVPPNFAEVRHVLNIAQVHSIAEKLQLITFDADGTIYADGHHIRGDNKMIGHIIKLMREGINVAIVTAAGYPGNAEKFENRLAGLLEAFKELELPPTITKLFHVMGGECNYLLGVNPETYKLEFIPDELWKSPDMLAWKESDIKELLDNAERSLKSAAARLRVPVEIIRKPRAVGAVPKDPTIYEVLEEMALTVQVQLMHSALPFCAFNGGNDVFVDVGNKSVGLRALMKFLNKRCSETLHVGDRFTVSGNDMATRSQCSILWVANPEETAFFARLLLRDIRLAKMDRYIE
ncbi:IMP-specific 5'-nucleotidase 1 [Physcomitrium patens]|uniref:IMP-specific 5'-nucleotidase 1 n=1 Tax=Physcomitrium patens TaxID=3218 RepID=UPI000D172DB3|nr:IMP-specific 5'-nucleotidase 1-like [Physcomitrium patens]|eukprot:XP_024384374.1 IMP-specific 5'-nucleotidase 1-like [Physcomitrella patens]